jgi:hypothetical protein
MKLALFGVLFGLILISIAFFGLRKTSTKKATEAVEKSTETSSKADSVAKYRVRSSLMSEPEQVLFHRLQEAFPVLNVFSQVSLNQLLYVPGSVESKRDRASMFNAINGKALDFVVCDLSGAVMAAIELDDRSHLRPDRVKADMQKDSAMASAGIPVHRFNVKEMPSVQQLSEMVLTKTIQGNSND